MPVIWGGVTGTASAIPGIDIGVVCAAVGYAIVAGILYWNQSSQPPAPYGVALDFCDDNGNPKGQDE